MKKEQPAFGLHRFGILIVGTVALLIMSGFGLTSLLSGRYPPDMHKTDTTTDVGEIRSTGQLLSAFFGLDNDLPLGADFKVCLGAAHQDGMPVIFDREVDVSTVQAGDFHVVTQSGNVGTIYCVTMWPAVDPGELRTALLVGEFGSATNDPPATLEITGNILSMDHTINLKGARIEITPLSAGPTLVWAESVPQSQWKPGKANGSWGSGSGCPQGTLQAVRATWAGGVKKANGEEAGDAERLLYRVSLEMSDGSLKPVIPFALADLDDGDNNHLLCLNVTGIPHEVSFPAGHLIDPNHDLNPDTSISVSNSPLP